MELENTLILLGTAMVPIGSIAYLNYRAQRSINNLTNSAQKVRQSTTDVLDAFTGYLSSRISGSKETNKFRKLARTRESYNI